MYAMTASAQPTLSILPVKKKIIRQKVTYENFICDHRPLNSEPCLLKLTVGGDRLGCLDETSPPEEYIPF